jgi:predicted ATPase
MLTRLKVKGFKNLVDVELRFGALTCIAGPNGVGKSNVFDAIRYLALLADKPFIDAAFEVRGGADPRTLFTSNGNGVMEFECDVLVPRRGTDDFGQPAEASSTFLTYALELRLEESATEPPRIRLVREELSYIRKGDARERLGFPNDRVWRDTVLVSDRSAKFISTKDGRVGLHSDRMRSEGTSNRGGGKAQPFVAAQLPRTALSSAQNADETRTAVLLRNEMRRWRQLQLEPSALRRADELQSPGSIDASGRHVASTLYRLANQGADPDATYAQVASRLAQLVDGVASVRVDRDDGRRLLRFMMTDRRGVELPAASLSDGTMRFVALSVLELDEKATGVICLEEPENGIHPLRVPAMIRLLGDMAVDVNLPDGLGNPLRQVILSTHSPQVVACAAEDDVLFANPRTHAMATLVDGLEFRGLNGTWRAEAEGRHAPSGEIGRYLGANAADDTSYTARRTVGAVYQTDLAFPTANDADR